MDSRIPAVDWGKILDDIDINTDKTIRFMPEFVEYVAQCPKCKTIETVEFVGKRLLPCHKFYQKDGNIYHSCGSNQPCHLHR